MLGDGSAPHQVYGMQRPLVRIKIPYVSSGGQMLSEIHQRDQNYKAKMSRKRGALFRAYAGAVLPFSGNTLRESSIQELALRVIIFQLRGARP